jgi:hypothetical protein
MSAPSNTTAATALALTIWRDHDEMVLSQPGVLMGTRAASGDPGLVAASLYRDGARRAALNCPVDLTGGMDAPTMVRAMLLLRELTSWGIVVDWQLRPGQHAEVWQRLNHLHPPSELLEQAASAEILQAWRDTFYLCKCVYRRGPGFVEVRDRRAGTLSRFVIDDPAYLAAVTTLLDGAPARDIPAQVLADFVAEGLVGRAGDLAWWLPYRVHRWPWPAMLV